MYYQIDTNFWQNLEKETWRRNKLLLNAIVAIIKYISAYK